MLIFTSDESDSFVISVRFPTRFKKMAKLLEQSECTKPCSSSWIIFCILYLLQGTKNVIKLQMILVALTMKVNLHVNLEPGLMYYNVSAIEIAVLCFTVSIKALLQPISCLILTHSSLFLVKY